MLICVIGNCQSHGLRACLAAMLPFAEVIRVSMDENIARLADSDITLVQTAAHDYMDLLHRGAYMHRGRVQRWPTFYFSAFHPDLFIDDRFSSPLGVYHSAITINGFLRGLSVAETVSLYRGDVFDQLGYFQHMAPSIAASRADLDSCGLDSRELLRSWIASGVFAHTTNHPTIFVIRTIATALLRKLEIGIDVHYPELFLSDLLESAKWPVHRDIAEKLEVASSEYFVVDGQKCSVTEFVERSYRCYQEARVTQLLAPERLTLSRDAYDALKPLVTHSRLHPYSDLPSSAFWRKSVEQRSPKDFDPVIRPKFIFGENDKIATAGSCFAQNIARVLIQEGLPFLSVEPPPSGLSEEEALERGYRLFSARYGNIYTARHLLQLIRRSTGSFVPDDGAWRRPDGRFVDPYRPQVEPEGYASPDDVLAATRDHLNAVRELFAKADIFIFTVGLTETWASTKDGAVFPIAPGVVAGEFAPDRYEFINMSVGAVVRDLTEAVLEIKKINPSIRVLLTVSPVPLVATYSGEHVICATTYSKSVLRTAVEEVCAHFRDVDYFPSYEIICGAGSDGRYFQADRRTVTAEGVDHVMEVLRRHYFNAMDFSYRPATPTNRRAAPPRRLGWLRNHGLEAREDRLFDAEWYLRTNPDVAAKGLDPFIHYREHGMREGRWPNAVFDPVYYRLQCAKDKRALRNPLRHYLTIGHLSGLRPNALFDVVAFSRNKSMPISGRLTPLESYIEFNHPDSFFYSDGERLEKWQVTENKRIASLVGEEIRASAKLLCDENALDGRC
jgi:hypothetical protein